MNTILDVRRIYRDSTARGAPPLELVILLYDAAIGDMQRALAAMQKSDIESRSAEIGHALMVLQQLQGTLDFEHGGNAAMQFERFYNLVRAKLLEAQMRGSPELMRQQIRYLSEVRDCWLQAKRLLQPVPIADGGSKSEWSA
ncbi:MAG TPA: flagellar export chaperone FliS [Candidatus Binatia bacterium]|nr:flagellar export chaperone FliS [Candidatus Binatia bacterium]